MLQQQKPNCIMGTEPRFRPDRRRVLAPETHYLQKWWHLSEVCFFLMTDGDLGSDQLRLAADGSKSGLIRRVWTFHSSNLLPNIADVAHLCVLALQSALTCSNNHDVIHLLFGPGEGWWLMRRLGIWILSDLGSCADRNLIKLHMPKQAGSFVHLGAKTALQLCFDIYHVWISVCFW